MEQRGALTPMLPPEQRILQDEEVRTPPRKEAHGHGSHRALNISYLQEGHELFPKVLRTSGQGTSVRTDGAAVGHWGTQQDLADIRAKNRLLRTPGVQPVVPTRGLYDDQSTLVWWDDQLGAVSAGLRGYSAFQWLAWDATAALQLLSHLQGDALNVALLVPMSRRTSRKGLVDALSAHYGSPGRLADYRRQFEKTTRSAGDDPSIFAIALETLPVKTFGDMRQTERLRLIRDRLIAGHGSCELRRYLDSVPPETPIRDVEDRCRVWKSHADPEIRRVSKPGPEPIYPAYVVGESDNGVDEV